MALDSFEKAEVAVNMSKPGEAFGDAVNKFKSYLDSKQFVKDSVVSISPINDAVLDWEEEFEGRVSPDEYEALSLMEQIVGTVNQAVSTEKAGLSSSESLIENSILSQRQTVKMILKNLDESGKPNAKMIRSLSLISSVFDSIYNINVIPERYLPNHEGRWQGIMGMATTALLFNDVGWSVGFADADLDKKFGVDLVVEDPKGSKYIVDVTSNVNGIRDEDLYKLKFDKVTNPKLLKELGDLKVRGKITINIPPIQVEDYHSFYEIDYRSVGVPSKESVRRLKSFLFQI